jgi:sec-independent protein translocase protein TatA
VNFAVFQSIGVPELLIVFAIILIIFGPKRLPGLGRQLGTGMREFKESITGKDSKRDLDEDEDQAGATAAARLDRPEDEPSPVEGEVVSERTPR